MTRRAVATGMAIGDSGAAVHASPAALASHYMVPGTLRSNTTSVSTANGTITPDSKCDMRLPVYVQGKGASFLVLRDVLLLDDCPHVLVSLGRLASESGIGTWLAPTGQQSYLIWQKPRSNEVYAVHVLNVGVIAIPTNARTACAGVTRGAAVGKTVDGGIIHARYLHRRAEELARLPACTSDVPAEWAAACKNYKGTPCDECLRSNPDAQPSNRSAPEVKSPGDLVSYDIWEVGVGHVHGGQKLVLNFHDHYSNINKPYLLEKYSDAPACIKMYLAWCRSHRVDVRHMHMSERTFSIWWFTPFTIDVDI
jgi:hypothetical protein